MAQRYETVPGRRPDITTTFMTNRLGERIQVPAAPTFITDLSGPQPVTVTELRPVRKPEPVRKNPGAEFNPADFGPAQSFPELDAARNGVHTIEPMQRGEKGFGTKDVFIAK